MQQRIVDPVNEQQCAESLLNHGYPEAEGRPVTLSRSIVYGGPSGGIRTLLTNHGGQVLFEALPSSGPLCVYSSMLVGGTLYKTSHCAQPFPGTYTLNFGPHVP